ncbi:MAG: SMP-30/gluconolactonase/LRE family protein [Sphingomonas fennica]
MEISVVDVPKCVIGEGPLWDVAEQALYWIDILGRRVWRRDEASGAVTGWDVPEVIGSMALRTGGGAIVALANGIHALDFSTGECSPFALPDPADPDVQFADGKVDPAGRFVTATSHRGMSEPRGHVWSLGRDRRLTAIDDDLILGNGPCWSPDGRTFYHADSVRRLIYAYDYDPKTGRAANRRPFADTADLGGIPDGATVDAAGRLWVAICEGGKVVCFDPDGTLSRVIDMPVVYPASVMFGGPDLDRLYVLSLNAGFLGKPVADGDGCLFVIDGLGCKGLPEPRYAG